MVNAALNVGSNLHILTATSRSQFLNPGDFLTEPNATGAVDAPSHIRRD